MKLLPALCLLALTPNAVLGACNADNVLRALQRSSAQASPFCSTYTQPPPNQPLPTYVSQYPASRVSSACSCLITSTPTPTPDACKSDRIINGNFETLVNYQATSWNFPGQVVNPSNSTLYTVAITSSNRTDDNVHFAFFYIYNNSTRTGQSTSITQNTKPLCAYTTYKLSYTSKLTITGGEYMGVTCTVRISLGGLQLVFIGPPNGDPPPFDRQTRETTFTTTGSPPGNLFKVELSCGAPAGEYVIDDISIVGV